MFWSASLNVEIGSEIGPNRRGRKELLTYGSATRASEIEIFTWVSFVACYHLPSCQVGNDPLKFG